MSGTARSRAQFLSQVRASFSQASLPSAVTVTPAPDAAVPSPPSTPPPISATAPQTQQPDPSLVMQLDALDTALTEVEENVVHRVPTAVPPAQLPVSPALLPPSPTLPAPSVSSPLPASPAMASFAAAIPTAIDQSTQTLNPQRPTTTTVKEIAPTAPLAPTMEQPQASQLESSAATTPVEVSGAATGYYESGPASPEIPPEIEAYLQEVKEHQEQLPHEIVVTNDEISLQPSQQPLRPVVVLPITPEVEKQGARKSPALSIRWLVEWSRRLMKMFTGKIVYQES